VFLSDDAWFSLGGEVNSQNSGYRSAENPGLIHELPVHDEKTRVWCAMNARRGILTVSFLFEFGQEGKIFSICCSTGEFLADLLKVIMPANILLASFTNC
jgi:hypothetical protein